MDPDPPGKIWMEQKGMTFDQDFYVDVGKQCRTENAPGRYIYWKAVPTVCSSSGQRKERRIMTQILSGDPPICQRSIVVPSVIGWVLLRK